LSRDWSQSTGIAAEVRAHGEQPIPLVIEQALFRVVQEALANIARHSGATAADIGIAWEQQTLTLAIHDNGHGFNPAERAGKGIGLRSMRERIEALGGKFLLASTEAGTHIVTCIPLPP
jgi:signal transduction histidine kinase